jgi:hypothetical protein
MIIATEWGQQMLRANICIITSDEKHWREILNPGLNVWPLINLLIAASTTAKNSHIKEMQMWVH